MNISFQQNRASRSVKTEHTNLFAKQIAKICNLQLEFLRALGALKMRTYPRRLIHRHMDMPST